MHSKSVGRAGLLTVTYHLASVLRQLSVYILLADFPEESKVPPVLVLPSEQLLGIGPWRLQTPAALSSAHSHRLLFVPLQTCGKFDPVSRKLKPKPQAVNKGLTAHFLQFSC